MTRMVASGSLPDSVLKFVKKNRCDLVVVGLHPQNEESIRNTYRLVCKAPCPVLGVRVSLKILSA